MVNNKCSYCGVPLEEGEGCSPSTQNCLRLMEFYEMFDKDLRN